ncbi:CopG family transcriptional regulator [Methylobacterium planeticum]|uniref:CopG family transcriptional regulator n=1 Tax=Methylobacterium planeticum TaxID=2615211 RepID=A0A6N6MWH6_9HYPH|nr:CopG family transcriptional regulator [Methylobacterium planeticum]KAB1075622.1 CopG family transcriptional regulator [Methylobacterium planeticum]
MLHVTPRQRNAARIGDSEATPLGSVGPGHADLLLSEGVTRNPIARRTGPAHRPVARRRVEPGRADLEAVRAADRRPDIRVLGLARLGFGLTPEPARETIASVEVPGGLQAGPEVRAALAGRLR